MPTQQSGFPTLTRAGLIATAATGQQAVATLTGTPYAGPGLGGNLVQNGDFSNGSAGWTLVAGDVVDTVPADAPPGSSTCLKKVAVSRLANTMVIPVLPNTTYTLGGWLRSDGTNTAQLRANTLTLGGVVISNPTALTASSTWTYQTAIFTTTGNITALQISCFSLVAATTYYGQICVAQGNLTAAQLQAQFASNPLGNTSLVACEATTNLLADGDCEGVGGTATSVLFNDSFATANAWTAVSGSAATAASNVLTIAAGSTVVAGHPDWWDTQASGGGSSQVRFQPGTGFTQLLFLTGYLDINHYIYTVFDGTTMDQYQYDNGVVTHIGGANAPCVLTAGTSYWLTWSRTGAVLSVSVCVDGATPGTVIATHSGTITATTWNTWGQIGFRPTGASLLLGQMGATAYAGVCQVSGPRPTNTSTLTSVGVPAFCWSKAQTFSGTYSLSIYHNDASSNSHWLMGSTAAAGTATGSCRVKTVGLGGGRAVFTLASTTGPDITGTFDWSPRSVTGTMVGNDGFGLWLQTSGLVYFDCLGVEQKAYQTLGLDPFPAFYVPTGARAIAAATIPTPSLGSEGTIACSYLLATAAGSNYHPILWSIGTTIAPHNVSSLISLNVEPDSADSHMRLWAGFQSNNVIVQTTPTLFQARVVATWKNGLFAFYGNGILLGMMTTGFIFGPGLYNSSLQLGGYTSSSGTAFNGPVSGLTVANHAWSAAEVAADFANGNPPGLIAGGGQYLQPGMLYAQTPDASGNSLALPPPAGGRVVPDVIHTGVVRAGSLQPLTGQSTVGVQGAVFDAAGLLQAGGLKHISATVGTSQVAVAHGLGRVPQIILFFERSNATSWQSAVADGSNVYLTASVAGTSVDLYVA